MARQAKAPYYDEEGQIGNQDLLTQLRQAVENLEEEMRASIPISRANHRVGFGVSKAKRGIAADSVISIARGIKVLKGW